MYICLLVSGIRGVPDFSCIGEHIICFIRCPCKSYVDCIFKKKEPVFGNLCMTPKTRTKTKVPTVRSVLFVRQFRSRMGPRKRGFEELIFGCQCSHFVAIRFGKISLSMLFCLRHGADQFYSFIISSSCVSGTHPGQSLSRNSKYDLSPSILKWCCSFSCVHISNDIPG